MQETTTSIWRKTAPETPRPAFRGHLHTQVAIIGAGLAGVLIADHLRDFGIPSVLLEANCVGSGQTQNSTAKITSQHGMIYDALIRNFGEKKARQYATANEESVRAYGRMIRERNIDCGYREAPAYLYTRTSKEPMEREAEAAARMGISARFQKDTELPFPIAGAVCFDRQACFHPLRFVQAVSKGLTIYERSPVLSVNGNRLRLPGGEVEAEAIVFACHFPFVNWPGAYFMRMHQERSYVLALQSAWRPKGLYYGVDNGGLSFREAEGWLLAAGENHRTGENSGGGRYEKLLSRVRSILPDARETARWSAQDCIPLDGMPYIGRFSSAAPNWYVATGFAKWGMSSAMVSALLIAGSIAGREPEWAEAFSPARFRLSASARNLVTDTVQTFKGLSRTAFVIPDTTLQKLPNGHGGIVEADGEKAGVYKDEQGRCFVVEPRCPHLGCQLEWNPDEKSWDCPCHGSRFRYDGSLLDNPAQEGLYVNPSARTAADSLDRETGRA